MEGERECERKRDITYNSFEFVCIIHITTNYVCTYMCTYIHNTLCAYLCFIVRARVVYLIANARVCMRLSQNITVEDLFILI